MFSVTAEFQFSDLNGNSELELKEEQHSFCLIRNLVQVVFNETSIFIWLPKPGQHLTLDILKHSFFSIWHLNDQIAETFDLNEELCAVGVCSQQHWRSDQTLVRLKNLQLRLIRLPGFLWVQVMYSLPQKVPNKNKRNFKLSYVIEPILITEVCLSLFLFHSKTVQFSMFSSKLFQINFCSSNLMHYFNSTTFLF